MHDDDLIARLRSATAHVPPSTLDLTAVLRSARRKRVRHRSAVATGCVAAVAGVGALAPGVPGLLDDDPAQTGVAAAAAACPTGVLDVSWQTQQQGPALRHAERVLVAEDGSTTVEEVVPFDAGTGLQAPGAPDEVRRAVLGQVRDEDRAGRYRDVDAVDEVTSVVSGAGGEVDGGPAAPFDGFVETEAEAGAEIATHFLDLAPGTYAAYDEGVQRRTAGTATCGAERWPLRLVFSPHERTGLLDCADVVADAFGWVVKDRVCPGGTTTADDEAAGLTDPAEQERWHRLVG